MRTTTGILLLALLSSSLPAQPTQVKSTIIDKHGVVREPMIDEKTGAIIGLYGLHDNIQDYGGISDSLTASKIDSIARHLVTDYSEALGITGDELELLDAFGSAQGSWNANYRQTFNGIPVEGTHFSVYVSPTGAIKDVGMRVFPKIQCETTPRISSEQAREILVAQGDPRDAAIPWPPTLMIRFQNQDSNRVFTLGWRSQVHMRSHACWNYFVDALSGQSTREECEVEDQGG